MSKSPTKARPAEQMALARLVAANPHIHLTHSEMALLLGVGEKCFRRIVQLNPPMMANKINPRRFDKWADENAAMISAIVAS